MAAGYVLAAVTPPLPRAARPRRVNLVGRRRTAVVRAVETGRPLLRAANTGISAIVEPSGSSAQTTELCDTALLTATVTPRTGMTPYVRFGDLLVGMCGLVLAGWTLNALRLRRWKESNQPSNARPLP